MSRAGGPTLGSPDRHHHVTLHAEDDRGDDDGRQGGLGYEGRVGHEEGEAEEDEEAGVEPSHGGPHPCLLVDGGPAEGGGHRHGLDCGAQEVRQTQGQHLLRSVHCSSLTSTPG